MPRIVTLTTDFGLSDPFVGLMKGVILGIAPQVSIVDLTHQIEPQNREQAAWVLMNSRPYFPKGTIHVVVVDPGVGTARRPILVDTETGILIGPDNGVLLEGIQNKFKVFELNQPRYFLKQVSNTFHGRDIFAPVAAWAAKGTAPSKMGRLVLDSVRLTLPQPRKIGNSVAGILLYADRFGNLATNITERHCPDWPPAGGTLRVGRRRITRFAATYAEIPKGKPGCLINSSGLVEIFLPGQNAQKSLKLKKGDPATLTWR